MKSVFIDGVEYVEKNQMSENLDGMPFCIVRCRDAGVHAGYVKYREGREVTLVNSRRLWRWWGKTLSGLAIEGSFAPEKCKYSNPVPKITVLDACEIIPCSEKGRKSIMEDVKEWKND